MSDEEIATLAVRSEVAADSTMFEARTVLFAHREGRVIETFHRGLPPLAVLGFDTREDGSGVDTLRADPPDYSSALRKRFQGLLAQLRWGIENQDSRAIGAVASSSAKINQQYLATSRFDELQEISRDSLAVGLQVAHSGTVAGLLFDAHERTCARRVAFAANSLKKLGIGNCYRISVC
jgi:uncharacterized protein involved in propanediol utilization